MLMYWASLEFACANGFQIFDFGRSTYGSGTFRFKEQWGAKPIPLHWYYWLSQNGPLPELNPSNPKYRAAISAWKMLPVGITKVVGPWIARRLP